MIAFQDIIQRLQNLLLEESGSTKILDREIALTLGLDPQYFAVIKRRKKIPYEALAAFCYQRHINLNWLLMGQEPRYLTSISS